MLADRLWESALRMPQIAIIMGCLVPIVGIISMVWYRAQKVRSDNQLKRTLVERGASAEEIERILAAGSEPGSGSGL